jgi:hypothetical protein
MYAYMHVGCLSIDCVTIPAGIRYPFYTQRVGALLADGYKAFPQVWSQPGI